MTPRTTRRPIGQRKMEWGRMVWRPLLQWLLASVLVVGLAGWTPIRGATAARAPLIATSPVGHAPSAIAVDPRSGHVFIANSATTRSPCSMRAPARCSGPSSWVPSRQVQVNPQTERVFVLNEGDGSVSVVDARTGAVLGTLRPTSWPVRLRTPAGAIFAFAAPGAAPGLGGLPGRRDEAAGGGAGCSRRDAAASVAGSAAGGGRPWTVDGAGSSCLTLMTIADACSMPPADKLCAPSPSAGPRGGRRGRPDGARLCGQSWRRQPPRSRRGASASSTAAAAGSCGPSSWAATPPSWPWMRRHSGSWSSTAGAVRGCRRWRGSGGIDVLDARTGARAGHAGSRSGHARSALAGRPSPTRGRGRAAWAYLPLDRAPGPHTGCALPAQVSILDDRRARVLGSLPVAAFPVAVAVDAPAARLFVVNNYADCHGPSRTWDNTATARPASCSITAA